MTGERRTLGVRVVLCVGALSLCVPSSPVQACKSTRCVVTTPCAKSAVQAKAVPALAVVAPLGAVIPIPVTLLLACGNNCGGVCNPAPTVTAAATTVDLCPLPGPCAAGCPSPIPPVVMPVPLAAPACDGRGVFNFYAVPIAVPAGVIGGFCVTATTTITYSDGDVINATGGQVACIVPELPGMPGVPRLDMSIDTTGYVNGMAHCAPGDQMNVKYVITNNDPTETLTLTDVVADSEQIARLPGGGLDESDGVYSISGNTADDFKVVFDPAPATCIALPDPATYVQFPISRPGTIVIPPLTSTTVTVGIRSYPACSNGSCSEQTLTVEGTYSPSGDPAFACAGTSLYVDTTVPFPGGEFPCEPCGIGLNDCNNNGVYDGDDIFVNQTSSDLNFNAIPDECEPQPPGVPALSRWSAPALAAVLVVAGVFVFGNRRARLGKRPMGV